MTDREKWNRLYGELTQWQQGLEKLEAKDVLAATIINALVELVKDKIKEVM